MPSTSAKQAKFMRAVAHSPKFAKKVGVPQSVGKDFEMADKKKMKFGDGGAARKPFPAMQGRSLTIPLDEPKPATRRGSAPTAAERAASRKQDESLKKAKVTKQEGKVIESANRSEGSGMKKGGEMKMKKMMADKAGRAMTKKSADTMGRAMVKKAGGGKCYAKGGSVSSRADGCAKKGRTSTKHVAMRKGGSC